MVNEVMENLDTFVLEPAPQVEQKLERMGKKVIKNLDTFVLEPAPQVRRGWSTWPKKSWRNLTHSFWYQRLRKEKVGSYGQ
jgi:hypothetical protein